MVNLLARHPAGVLAFACGFLAAGAVAAGLASLAPARTDGVDAPGPQAGGVRPDMLPGPVPARVLRVIDGDTVEVSAAVWVGQSVDVAVRLRGMDAPELRGACEEEQSLAREARSWLDREIGGATIVLTRIEGGKYFGRVVADIATADGRALGPEMLAAGLARPYAGGRRQDWCAKQQGRGVQ